MEDLVAIIKAGQKNNSDFKNKWAQYCLENNDGFKDPVKHSQESLETFVNAHKDEYGSNEWFLNPQKYLPMNNPNKNTGGSTGDSHKDRLVMLIKAGQRKSDDWKNCWSDFAARELNDVRNPAAHTAEILERFIATHKEPYQTTDWFNRPEEFAPKPRINNNNNNMGGPFNFGGPNNFNGPNNFGGGNFSGNFGGNNAGSAIAGMNMMMNPMIQNNWHMMKESTGPAPHDLVQMIKDGQRANQHLKEQWHSFCDTYCDGIRDPTRHPAANIIQFCEMMGIMPNNVARNNSGANMGSRFRPY